MDFEEVKIEELSNEERDLIFAARNVMKNAYNIYSDFFVGAGVLTKKDIHVGAFMENASLGLTICAEPAAIQSAVTSGDYHISAIAVVGGKSDELDSLDSNVVTPCGRCRQIIYEFSVISKFDITVLCCNASLTKIIKTSISKLLPLPFGPSDLGLVSKLESFS
jgi:cytidine deaminase